MSGELQLFVLRGEVRKLYRQFIRLCRKAPNNTSRTSCICTSMRVQHHPPGELLAQVRHEFGVHRHHADPYAVKYALSDGRTRLKQLRDMLNLAE